MQFSNNELRFTNEQLSTIRYVALYKGRGAPHLAPSGLAPTGLKIVKNVATWFNLLDIPFPVDLIFPADLPN